MGDSKQMSGDYKRRLQWAALLGALMFPTPGVSSRVVGQESRPEDMQEEKRVEQNSNISEEGKRRIRALVADKEKRTAAERKIDSRLLYVIKSRRGEETGDATREQLGIPVDAEGRCLVDLHASVSEQLLKKIRNFGGAVLSSFKQFDAVRALVPIESLAALAADPAVKFIRPAEEAATDNAVAPGTSERLSAEAPLARTVDAGKSAEPNKVSAPAKAKRRRPHRRAKRLPKAE